MLCLHAAHLGEQVAVIDGQELGEVALDGRFGTSCWSSYKGTSVRN